MHAMASDQGLRPAVRLRAATAMAELHREYRDKAACTARTVMQDKAAPRHLRIKAARALAKWSDPCRAEAQALLVELAGG